MPNAITDNKSNDWCQNIPEAKASGFYGTLSLREVN